MIRISVVVKTEDGYKDFHVDVNTDKPELVDGLRRKIAKEGFTVGGTRYFPDKIESLVLTEIADAQGTDRQEGGEYQETNR